jgi:electron transfer flavoprotein alpha subunit
VEHAELTHFLPEPYAGALAFLIGKQKPEILIAGATTTGRTVMPLVAVKCHAGLTADCTQLEIEQRTGNLLQIRPAIGGNILATIKSPAHRPEMATVRPRSCKPLPRDESRTGRIIRETVPPELLKSRVKWLGFEPVGADTANILEAEVIISGGRGLKKRDNFALIGKLAGLLNAAVGASRDAVDRGWITYPHQVGLSGKTVSPRLYLCAGVSGSIQHLAGIKTAENIIATNTNPEAQIFKVANYGIVGDLFEVLPLLIRKIEARKKTGASLRHGSGRADERG